MHRLANLHFTSFITRLQHIGHARLQRAGIKSDLQLTSIDSEQTPWLSCIVLIQIRDALMSRYDK